MGHVDGGVCLLSEKPDYLKTNVELKLDIIRLFQSGIDKARASRVAHVGTRDNEE